MVILDGTIAGAAIRAITGRTPLAVDPEEDGFVVDVGTERWAVVPTRVPPSLDGVIDALLDCSDADIIWDPAPRPQAVAVVGSSGHYHLNDRQGLTALWPRIAAIVSAADLADLLVAYQATGPRHTVIDERSDWRQFVGPEQPLPVPDPGSLAWTTSPGGRELEFGSWCLYLGVDPDRHGLELYHWRIRAMDETIDWTVTQVGRNLPSPFLHADRGAR